MNKKLRFPLDVKFIMSNNFINEEAKILQIITLYEQYRLPDYEKLNELNTTQEAVDFITNKINEFVGNKINYELISSSVRYYVEVTGYDYDSDKFQLQTYTHMCSGMEEARKLKQEIQNLPTRKFPYIGTTFDINWRDKNPTVQRIHKLFKIDIGGISPKSARVMRETNKTEEVLDEI